jgi:hypothetical protein
LATSFCDDLDVVEGPRPPKPRPMRPSPLMPMRNDMRVLRDDEVYQGARAFRARLDAARRAG